MATSERDSTDPVATRSYFEVAAGLIRHGIEVSVSQTWRILTGMDIDLTKVRGWLNRRDAPDFWERVQDICGLYLVCPESQVRADLTQASASPGKDARRRRIRAMRRGGGRR